ncbi:hypothetical protein E2C01_055180 [Portunus trituberculatus]|uniref:Uncharacterized protein n=1 Tax=Portunus trituberculatus TaxID=210409 RepID=A0A5B7GV94_PORTR|nr:hypothetical protein [Portunus trituberculatus]
MKPAAGGGSGVPGAIRVSVGADNTGTAPVSPVPTVNSTALHSLPVKSGSAAAAAGVGADCKHMKRRRKD